MSSESASPDAAPPPGAETAQAPAVVGASALLRELVAGLRWLYDIEQPATAVQDCHGRYLANASANRTVHFLPAGFGGHAIIILELTDTHPQGNSRPNHALCDGEVEAFADLIGHLGETVLAVWSESSATAAAFVLKRLAHHTLRAAVARFTDGPHRHTLDDRCDCPWYLQQSAATIGIDLPHSHTAPTHRLSRHQSD